MTYEERRNMLIPRAEKYAEAVAGERPPTKTDAHEIWATKYNLAFHTEMNRLYQLLNNLALDWNALSKLIFR